MRRRYVFGGVALGVGLVWWMAGSPPAESKLDGSSAPTRGTGELRGALGNLRSGSASSLRLGQIRQELRASGLVQITGMVVDRVSTDRVGEVEVVFRGPAGEQSTIAGADGSYRIELEPGAYRAFVRDESVLSIGAPVEERLPGFPDLDAIGAPDESAMPLVVAQTDLEGVDLFVLRGGTIHGVVRDAAGHPIAHAMVRALSGRRLRPALGSDLAETDADGSYELRVPAGEWQLELDHARFAGLDGDDPQVSVSAGERVEHDLVALAGCVIAGKVIGANGLPAGDGAVELGYDGGFAPSGKIAADGTFRWTTLGQREIRLRAWPWKSPPSEEQRFACRDGARFTTTFHIPARGADIGGVLVDASGAPVPLAFLDLAPLDEGGLSQQERSGIDGTWGVFAMPAGRYQLTAYAPGRGVISTVVTSPSAGVRLQLGGTGTVDGTVQGLTNGSFELQLAGCSLDGTPIKITEDTRLVSVRGGRFTLSDLPACDLFGQAKWRDSSRRIRISVTPNGHAALAIDFTAAPPEQVDLDEPGDPEPIPDGEDVEIIDLDDDSPAEPQPQIY